MKVATLALVTGLVVLGGGCAQDPEARARKFVELGKKYYDREQYKEASILYRRALQQDGRSAEAYYRLGLALKQLAMPQATGAFIRAFELDPHNLDAFLHLAEAHLLTLSLPVPQSPDIVMTALLDHTQRAEQRNPGTFEVLYIKGRIAAFQKSYDQAIALLREAQQLRPESGLLSFFIAATMLEDGRGEEAERTALAGLEKDPGQPRLYDLLYVLYTHQGRLREAEEMLQTKCERNPDAVEHWIGLALHYWYREKVAEMEATLNRLISDPQRRSDARGAVGDFYMLIRRPDLALEHYRAGLEAKPKNERLFRYSIVRAHLATGDPGKATEVIDGLLADDPNDWNALGLRGIVALRSGKEGALARALADLKAAVEELPDNISLRHSLGQAYLMSGDPFHAEGEFRRTLELKPDFRESQYALIDLYLLRNQFTEAQVLADSILREQPLDPHAALGRSVALIGLDERASARQELTKLIERGAVRRDAEYYLARLTFREGKYQEAEARFRRLAAATPPDPRAALGVLDVLRAQGRTSEAKQYLDQLVKAAPASTNLRLALVKAAIADLDYDRAQAELDLLLAAHPDNADALTSMAQLSALRGNHAAAMDYYQRAANAPRPTATAFFGLGTMLAAQNEFASARQHLQRALELDPDSPVILNNLAFVLAESGTDLDTALTYAQRAVARAPHIADFADTLGIVYLKKNLNENAVKVLSEIAGKHPSRFDFQYRFGLALFRNGDPATARSVLTEALANGATGPIATETQNLLTRIDSEAGAKQRQGRTP